MAPLKTRAPYVLAVDSHQPLPANQLVSSGIVLYRRDWTLATFPFANTSESRRPVSSSRAPMHGVKTAPDVNVAAKLPAGVRVIRSMYPAPCAGVSGNNSRPPGRNAFVHT